MSAQSLVDPLCQVGVPHEIGLHLTRQSANPYADTDVTVLIRCPDDTTMAVKAFWKGGNAWCARFAPQMVGVHSYKLYVSGGATPDIAEGEFEASPYDGDNWLYRHGPVQASGNGRYLCHQDGEPFFWLADTWWYGATRRCRWPDDFQLLVRDRVDKGFTVVQIVVGIPPEVAATDPAAWNEGGPPFTERWSLINPAYFEYADKRIKYLVDNGLVPCIVGGWGHHIEWMGIDNAIRFWEYLVARYAAYPVIWCLSGETELHAELPLGVFFDGVLRLYYAFAAALGHVALLHKGASAIRRVVCRLARTGIRKRSEDRLKARRDAWIRVGQAVAGADPARHIITTHPITGRFSHQTLDNAAWVGVTSIQSGHSEDASKSMFGQILQSARFDPRRPIINMEPWYERILGRFGDDDQRYAFWMCVLAGAAGHSYGANGLWQMSTEEDGFLGHWGVADWSAAYRYPGSTHLGLGKQLLSRFKWWQLQPRLECVMPHWSETTERLPVLASIGEGVLIGYFPKCAASTSTVVRCLAPDRTYRAFWFDPRTGAEHPVPVEGISGVSRCWTVPPRPTLDDWVLVIERSPS
ncbi:MAG TPA: DUF4038 domain-containing protein [Anaerolineae bacterium]|nr:DUF4038 domain-containing protein [Anaerolineae bacterium]